jgi:hypothetical protein
MLFYLSAYPAILALHAVSGIPRLESTAWSPVAAVFAVLAVGFLACALGRT